MRLAVKDSLTEQEIESGLRAVIKDGMASTAMATLTGGAFLVAFALKLGASNLVIGLLAAIPPLAQLIQIPSIYLVERLRNRRAISVATSTGGRIFWLFIALIPFVFPKEGGLNFLIVAILINGAFIAVSNCSWNSWMRDLVPQDRLGAFFSRRMTLSVGLSIVLSLAAAFYIDYWRKHFPHIELYGYSALFAAGFIAGMIGVYFISTIPESRIAPAEGKAHFFALILKPFKDANFKELIMFLGSWNFAVNLAAPFFTVYMLKRLQLDLYVIIAFTVLSQIMNLSFLRIWGRFSDRYSNKSVLGVSGPLFIGCIFAFTFTAMPEKHMFTLPLLVFIHIFMGISTAGVTLATGNIGLKLAPKGQATAYLAANSLVNSLAAGIAPILGGKFADFFAERKLSLMFKWTSPGRELTFQTLHFQHWDFFFLFAFLIGLYCIHRLTRIKEIGHVEEKIVVRELITQVRRDMRNLSTVGGLRQMVNFPISVVYFPLSILNRIKLGKKSEG
jgi:MFS family permease